MVALVVSSMLFWFRDIVAEGTENLSLFLSKTSLISAQSNYKLKTAKAIPIEDISKALNTYKANNINNLTTNNLGYYLAGLLEGDGHISIPALGITTLNRILNPRIVLLLILTILAYILIFNQNRVI